MHLAVTYGRCSTDKQEHSIATQTDSASRYMSQHDLLAVSELEFADPAVSGRKKPGIYERPGGRHAVDVLRGGIYDHDLSDSSQQRLAAAGIRPDADGVYRPKDFVVAVHDRISRDGAKTMEFYDWCLTHGYRLHLVNLGGMDLSNADPFGAAMTKMVVAVLAYFSELEVAQIRSRISNTFRSKRARGELCSSPAYGQRRVDSGRTHVREGNVLPIWTWEEDPAEMAVLRQFIQWHYVQHLGIWKITTLANQCRYPTKYGGPWKHGKTDRVLHNCFTKGQVAQMGLIDCQCPKRKK